MTTSFDNLFDDDAPVGQDTVIEQADGQRIENPLRFILAGNATFTLRSRRTGTRFTYRVRQSEDGKVWFVSLLTGPENTRDYAYMGIVRANSGQYLKYGSHSYWHDRKGKTRIHEGSPGATAFTWAFKQFVGGADTSTAMDVFFAGTCGRCGRQLTVPESVTAGFGPECIGKV